MTALRPLDTLAQDVRYALRTLWRAPLFTAIAIGTLALGIGACTTIYSAMDAVLLHALPFPAVDRLVAVGATTGRQWCNSGSGDYLGLRRESRAFSSVGAWFFWSGTMAGREGAEPLDGYRLTPSMFTTLATHAALGRTFEGDSASTELAHTVVLSDRFWRARFGADRRTIGKTIELSGEPYVVAGVMPPSFAFPRPADVWLPLTFTAADAANHEHCWLRVVARLAPGASPERAGRELAVISTRIAAEDPAESGGWRLAMHPLSDEMLGNFRKFFIPLMGAVGFVLLIACANVANLLLARASGRGRELAVRASLGATRARIARQLLTESLLLAGGGAAVGALLAWWAVPVLRNAVPGDLARDVPGWDTLALDPRALAFTAGLGMMCGLVFGVLPALRASRVDMTASLKEGGRGATAGRGGRARGALVIGELALALVLLVATGLMIRSFVNLVRADTGVRAEGVLTMSLSVPRNAYGGRLLGGALYRRVREEVGALPGVVDAAAVSHLPMGRSGNQVRFQMIGRTPVPPSRAPWVTELVVTPGYFSTFAIPLLRGRDFTSRDDSAAPRVAIVSRAMAHRWWPGEDALGRGLEVDSVHYEIVGIVGDVHQRGVNEDAPELLYRAEAQVGYSSLRLVARTTGDPARAASAVRRALARIDPRIAISDVRTMPRVVSDYLAPWRLLMALLGIFAAIALVIAAMGMYAVMAYAVQQRTHEIGIRVALGAERSQVLAMMLRHGAALAGAGVALGALGALATTRVLSFLLYGVSTGDPAVLAGVTALLAGVMLLACWSPVRRATRVDPMTTLRAE